MSKDKFIPFTADELQVDKIRPEDMVSKKPSSNQTLLRDRNLPRSGPELLEAPDREQGIELFTPAELIADNPEVDMSDPILQPSTTTSTPTTRGNFSVDVSPGGQVGRGSLAREAVAIEEPAAASDIETSLGLTLEELESGLDLPFSAGGGPTTTTTSTGVPVPRLIPIPDRPQRRGGGGPAGMLEGSQSFGVMGSDPELVAREQQAFDEYSDFLGKFAQEQSLTENEIALQEGQRALEVLNSSEALRAQAREAQQLREQRLNQLNQLNDELMSQRMNPNRFYSSRGPGARMGASIAVALGAFGASLTGRDNEALSIINDAIERDLLAQENDLSRQQQGISTARSLYGDLVSLTNDRQQAELMFLDLKMSEVEARLEQIRHSGASRQILAQTDALLAQLRQQRAQTALDLDRSLNQTVLRRSFQQAIPAQIARQQVEQDIASGFVGQQPEAPPQEETTATDTSQQVRDRSPSSRGAGGRRQRPQQPREGAVPSIQTSGGGQAVVIPAPRGRVSEGRWGRPSGDPSRSSQFITVPLDTDENGQPNVISGWREVPNSESRTEGGQTVPVVVRQFATRNPAEGGPNSEVVPRVFQRNGQWFQIIEENRFTGFGFSREQQREIETSTETGPMAVGTAFVVERDNPEWRRLTNNQKTEIRDQVDAGERAYAEMARLLRLRRDMSFLDRIVGPGGSEARARSLLQTFDALRDAGLAPVSDLDFRNVLQTNEEGVAEWLASGIIGDRAGARLRVYMQRTLEAINRRLRPYGGRQRGQTRRSQDAMQSSTGF